MDASIVAEPRTTLTRSLVDEQLAIAAIVFGAVVVGGLARRLVRLVVRRHHPVGAQARLTPFVHAHDACSVAGQLAIVATRGVAGVALGARGFQRSSRAADA